MHDKVKKFCPYCGHKQTPANMEHTMLDKFRQHKIHLSCKKCNSVMVIRKYISSREA